MQLCTLNVEACLILQGLLRGLTQVKNRTLYVVDQFNCLTLSYAHLQGDDIRGC